MCWAVVSRDNAISKAFLNVSSPQTVNASVFSHYLLQKPDDHEAYFLDYR